MNTTTDDKPEYGNWVPARLIYGIGGIALLSISLYIIFYKTFLSIIFFILVLIILFCFGYLIYGRYALSYRKGTLQSKIQNLVLDCLDWDGKGTAIDIGCGNGPLTVKLARKYPEARVTGIDYWSGIWEYSKNVCEKNAHIEGVAERTSFRKASASSLPFESEFFDIAVSNLAFHEVKDAKDKRDVIRESLRVIRKGGKFSFQDLFLFKKIYGELDDLLETIRSWGVERVEFMNTNDSEFIPRALKAPFMLGRIGIIYGTK